MIGDILPESELHILVTEWGTNALRRQELLVLRKHTAAVKDGAHCRSTGVVPVHRLRKTNALIGTMLPLRTSLSLRMMMITCDDVLESELQDQVLRQVSN